MFTSIGRIATRFPWLVCLAWLLLGVGLTLLAPRWDSRAQDDDIRFLPSRTDSVRGYQLLEKAFPQEVYASRIIFALERPDAKLTDADLVLVDQLVADIGKLKQAEPDLKIGKIYSQRDPFLGKRLLSEDGRCTLIQVSLGTPYLALQTRATVDRADAVVRERLSTIADAPTVHTTGPAGVGRDLVSASAGGLDTTTVATLILVVVILLVVYRSPVLALIPLASIAVAVWVALEILALMTLIPGFYLVNISQIFAVVMLYGAGTDYCLFLIARYREELTTGKNRRDALTQAVGGVGGALFASAATVICGLGMMGFAEFAKVRCGGPAIAVSLAVALVASLTLTPALLRILGKVAFWPAGQPTRFDAHNGHGVWEKISAFIVARPLRCGGAALAVLVPLAILGLRVSPTYRATAELSSTSSSITGIQAIARHYTAGELGPVTILLESAGDWDSLRGRRLVDHLSRGFLALDNVAEVRSLTQPLGKVEEEATPDPTPPQKNLRGSLFSAVWRNVAQGVSDQVAKSTRAFYLTRVGSGDEARNVTRLDVVLKTDPFEPRSVETLARLRLWVRESLPEMTGDFGTVRAECFGVTVNAHDLAEVTERDRRWINAMVIGGIFLILLFLVRHPGLAAYLLVTVLLSYYATLGATTILAHTWHGRPIGEIDWRVPFFLFTILVAVGEDYNILLITRALEERKLFGGVEGTRRALACTGGTITSCGLIMAGTFATLMLTGLNTLVQVGFALAFGVLLDTFLVRPVLVPAFTVLLWRDETRDAMVTRRAA